MEINCVIVEDEPLAVEKLTGFICKVSFLRLIQTFDNGIDAIGFIKSSPVDLIFLDIQMDKFTGIQLLESLSERPQVIIVSAYDQYALKGYEFSVTDYLLKPYSFERFVQAVDKVAENYKIKQKNLSLKHPVTEEIIFVKTEYRIEKINLNEILYIKGMKDYQMIVTRCKKIMTLQGFREIERVLPEPSFIRVHKSYIVALDKIERIEHNRIHIQNELLPIGETYKDKFFRTLKSIRNLLK
jgi:DNA-binding LytR/AlgR family response regulator